jgi:hypothetical protein
MVFSIPCGHSVTSALLLKSNTYVFISMGLSGRAEASISQATKDGLAGAGGCFSRRARAYSLVLCTYPPCAQGGYISRVVVGMDVVEFNRIGPD